MKISQIEIFNWRSIAHESIESKNLMIFIGQNNHGKSNILTAIQFFFGEIPHQNFDFHNESNELWIEMTFCELNEQERVTFQKYVTNENRIKVRKSAIKNDSFSYYGYVEEPKNEWLKETSISNYLNRELADRLPLSKFLPSTGRITKDIFRQAQKDYIKENKESLVFDYHLEITNFLGAKNVAKGSFGDLYFIPSIKNATDELSPKGNSIFSNLYSRVVNKMSETNTEYIEAKKKISELIKILNKTDENGTPNTQRPSDLGMLETIIDAELNAWNTKIDIEITPPNIDDIFKVGTHVLVDDGIKTDISRKGHGLQRALIFALIKAWSQILKQEEEVAAANGEDVTISSRVGSKSTYFIFEEPELFLHPQAQKELFSSLVNLSENNNQVFLCTHSSSFLDLAYHESICIVKKNSIEEGTKIVQCTEAIFSGIDERKEFNMSYWINPDRSELFFAKKIILVEGQTDKSVIPMIAKELDVFKFEYSIIDCGSKNNIPQYINLLNKFRLSYVAVYDRDHQGHKDPKSIVTADISSRTIEDAVDSQLGRTVIFENDIEQELGMTESTGNNKAYNAISFVNREDFTVSDQLKAKVKSIYA